MGGPNLLAISQCLLAKWPAAAAVSVGIACHTISAVVADTICSCCVALLHLCRHGDGKPQAVITDLGFIAEHTSCWLNCKMCRCPKFAVKRLHNCSSGIAAEQDHMLNELLSLLRGAVLVDRQSLLVWLLLCSSLFSLLSCAVLADRRSACQCQCKRGQICLCSICAWTPLNSLHSGSNSIRYGNMLAGAMQGIASC